MKTEAHYLMPESVMKQIPALYATQDQEDPTVWLKYFTPDSSWTWYVTEFDPGDRLCFGLVVGHETELGYFTLDELETTKGPLGVHIERDLYFREFPLSKVQSLYV
jgi:hypothetical protein